jgi:putative hydrolase of HD superfamily
MNNDFNQYVDFILKLDEMKTSVRRNINVSTKKNENDAEHSWHMATMALLLKDRTNLGDFDVNKSVQLCIVHDLVEIYAGDTFCWDAKANLSKTERELASADKLFSLLPNGEGKLLRDLWEEFEQCTTKESLFANAMDRLQPFILNVNTNGHTWQLAHPTYSQVKKRVSIAYEVIPFARDFIDSNIEYAVTQGWIIDDRK